MKKKIAMFFLAGAMLVSLCACGSKKDTVETKNEETQVATEAATQGDATDEASKEVKLKVKDREDYVPIEKIDVNECVSLSDYKGIVVNATKEEVTDDDIKSYINYYILKPYPVTDRAVANGDTVTIDFVGKKDGVAFDGGTAQGYQLEIGSGSFIPGFEEGLVGVMPGQTKSLELTFPEDYHADELKGQAVVFDVTVHNIMETPSYDELTEELIAAMQLEYKSNEEIWNAANEKLNEKAQSNYESTIKALICQHILDNCSYNSVPKHLVEEQVENYNDIMTEQLKYYGVSIEDYAAQCGFSLEEFNKTLESDAETEVKFRLAIEAIARAEGIEVTDEEVEAAAIEEANNYNVDVTDVKEIIDQIGESQIRMSILSEKVMDLLMSTVTVEPAKAE